MPFSKFPISVLSSKNGEQTDLRYLSIRRPQISVILTIPNRAGLSAQLVLSHGF